MAPETDPYEGVNVNLASDEVDALGQPIPDVSTNFVVVSAERKRKEGSKFPYTALMVSPLSDDPKISRRKLFLNLTFHPEMLKQLRNFRKACGMDINVDARKLLADPNTDQQYVGQRFSCVPKIVPGFKDPERKQNELSEPFRPAF